MMVSISIFHFLFSSFLHVPNFLKYLRIIPTPEAHFKFNFIFNMHFTYKYIFKCTLKILSFFALFFSEFLQKSYLYSLL